MKSLIIKDLFNVKNYFKQVLFSLFILAVCFIPNTGVEGFIVASCVVCSTMTITSFSFDERSKWEKYALIMPVSRKEYVMSKYLLNLLFGVIGGAIGLLVLIIVGISSGYSDIISVLACVGTGIVITIVEGSIVIPIILRYGSENARIIMITALAVPMALVFLIYKGVQYFDIQVTSQLITTALWGVGIFIVFMTIYSYILSKKWFYKKEF